LILDGAADKKDKKDGEEESLAPFPNDKVTFEEDSDDATDTSVDNVEGDDDSIFAEGHDMFPREVVAELDRNIVGQDHAKRAVAIAFRNRWRRRQVPKPLRDEIVPKNILMVGPTGVGKTEIARRLAKMCHSPFIKVEATKFTEVGFHGRDVDQIIRDLVDVSIGITREHIRKENVAKVNEIVNNRLLDLLGGKKMASQAKDAFRNLLEKGLLENRIVEFTPEAKAPPLSVGNPNSRNGYQEIQNIFQQFGNQRRKQKMTVSAAREILQEEELDKIADSASVLKRAISNAESSGIVFIDEIDKIVTPAHRSHTADGSSEGVQRDLLPIVEGCTVHTKYGNIETGKILFIASGAFHSVKPSDMMAELQGRLPIRVELKGLTESDMHRILTEPESNQIKQQIELMKTEGIELEFTDEAVKRIAKVAAEINESVENIGAR
tara:strand:+ start:1050 stop:2360 length:1311 start_codon:yes stop_codon:yes gene_type:complete